MPVLDRPRIIPFRWPGHRLDIRTTLDEDGAPLFAAADICEALGEYVGRQHDTFMGITRFSWPAGVVTVDGLLEPDQQAVAFFRLSTVYGLAEHRPMHSDASEFLEFFHTSVVRSLVEPDFVADVTPLEPGLREQSISVGKAAYILSRDPAIKIGRDYLFDCMRTIGWVARATDAFHTWIPTEATLRAGMLVRHQVRVPGRKELYPQIRITTDGLQELHRRLGGVATVRIDAPGPLTLVELADE